MVIIVQSKWIVILIIQKLLSAMVMHFVASEFVDCIFGFYGNILCKESLDTAKEMHRFSSPIIDISVGPKSRVAVLLANGSVYRSSEMERFFRLSLPPFIEECSQLTPQVIKYCNESAIVACYNTGTSMIALLALRSVEFFR